MEDIGEEQAEDFAFLKEELPKAVDEALAGTQQVAGIVRALKAFAHPSADKKDLANLNKALENVIMVARNEWKYVAEMETDFSSDLPLVSCILGDINQVVLNLVVNAAHAIADTIGTMPGTKGKIRVSTLSDSEWVTISVSDTGGGIPEAIQARVFDPFFTTKEVGRGTGQGLALAHSIVVEKHNGQLTFETKTGKGTTFFIKLPVKAD